VSLVKDAHAVSRAVSAAVQEYYRRAGHGREAELLGRLFEQWLGYFRRAAWSCGTGAELLEVIKAAIPVDEGALRDVLG
jgi:hypothetical protein